MQTVCKTQNTKKGIAVVLSGPSGCGKGTIVKELLRKYDDVLALSVSATTRAPRVGEVDGREYYFISKEDFERRIEAGEILEYTTYCGNYYGTPKKELVERTEAGIHVILEIEVEGSMNIRKRYPEAVHVFVLPPDLTTLEARLRGRGTNTEEDIAKRLARAKEEIGLIDSYDYVVVNRDGGVEAAADEVFGILCAEQLRVSRNCAIASPFLT